MRGREMRRAPRIKKNIIVTIKPLRGLFEVDATEGIMLDLSKSGMAVLVRKPMPMDTTVISTFKLIDLSDGAPSHIVAVKVVGEIRYNRVVKPGEYHLGISFSRVDEKDRQAIEKFLTSAGG